MESIGDLVHEAARMADAGVDAWKRRYRERFGWSEPIRVVVYRGHGAPGGRFMLRGRVLAGDPLDRPGEDAGVVRNVLDMWVRFNSSEIEGAELLVSLDGRDEVLTTDEEGYFTLEGDVDELPGVAGEEELWRPVPVELRAPRPDAQSSYTFEGRCQVPGRASLGVISDMDDTVLYTGATQMTTMIKSTLLHNARTRMPFPGVEPFYRALHHGESRRSAHNPIWYVSSSPWNLYDFFESFLAIHDLPEGTFFLRDLGIDEDKFIQSSHGDHKLDAIRRILEDVPELPFLLVGDSGQHDPEIYERVVEEYPERIAAIFIRDVTPDARDREVEAIAERCRDRGVPFLFAETMIPCAEFAASRGWIDWEDVEEVTSRVVEARKTEERAERSLFGPPGSPARIVMGLGVAMTVLGAVGTAVHARLRHRNASLRLVDLLGAIGARRG
jgi:phosphatidate phosphatase APP1